jgi:hypothetical protein
MLTDHPSGNSGGPVLEIGPNGEFVAIGVHCYGGGKGCGKNKAAIIDDNLMTTFLWCLSRPVSRDSSICVGCLLTIRQEILVARSSKSDPAGICRYWRALW